MDSISKITKPLKVFREQTEKCTKRLRLKTSSSNFCAFPLTWLLVFLHASNINGNYSKSEFYSKQLRWSFLSLLVGVVNRKVPIFLFTFLFDFNFSEPVVIRRNIIRNSDGEDVFEENDREITFSFSSDWLRKQLKQAGIDESRMRTDVLSFVGIVCWIVTSSADVMCSRGNPMPLNMPNFQVPMYSALNHASKEKITFSNFLSPKFFKPRANWSSSSYYFYFPLYFNMGGKSRTKCACFYYIYLPIAWDFEFEKSDQIVEKKL